MNPKIVIALSLTAIGTTTALVSALASHFDTKRIKRNMLTSDVLHKQRMGEFASIMNSRTPNN